MTRAAGLVLAVAVLAPATAGAGTTRPPLALTATPAHVSLVGSGRASIRVTNSGRSPVVLDAGRAGFALDLRGRPRVVRPGVRRAAASWLTVRPARFRLRPGASTSLTVSSRIPPRVEPGDHDALVLVTSRPRPSGAVAVRMRIGVVVVVRAPGRVVRRLDLRELRVRRAHGRRALEVLVVNRGNVTERLRRSEARVHQRGSPRARLLSESRELRPRSRGVVQFRYRGPLRGWVTVRAAIAAETRGPVATRTFRVKL